MSSGAAEPFARGYGWLRYLTTFESELSGTDTRDEASPYEDIFCHDSEIDSAVDTSKLPNRNALFEFRIAEGQKRGQRKAVEVRAIEART